MTNHEQELLELKTFFAGVTFPKEALPINKYMRVSDPKLFIESQINQIEQYQGPDGMRDSLLTKLRELKVAIEHLK
jgi:hypothetical protein